MELLTRLPGRQVARCKCVCKLWRSMIVSAHFKDVYGSHHRVLICHWVEPITKNYPETALNHLSFNQSPIRGLKEPEEEEFGCLYKLGINRKGAVKMTQIVNGLLCVDHETAGLSIYNVCTGERMRIPDLLPLDDSWYDPSSFMPSSFHLGYDPSTRLYKLLRLIPVLNHPTQAQIITMSSSSMWRELNHDASGIPWDCRINWSSGHRVSPTDGFLCWYWFACTPPWFTEGLVLFDISKEKFQKIWLPRGYYYLRFTEMCVQAQIMEHNKRLAVSIWCICKGDFLCFVMRDDEGKRWGKHSLEFPRLPYKEDAVFVAATWNSCEMVMMDNDGSNVYCYGRDHTMSRFQIGKIPTGEHGIAYGMKACGGVIHHWYLSRDPLIARPSYLLDGNNLYLPLDDILAGRI